MKSIRDALTPCGLLLLVAVMPLGAQQPPASDVSAALSKTSKSRSGKLDPALEAIARAWRLHGTEGARRESAAQNVKLNHLRLSGIIRLADGKRKSEVEKALRRAWGVVTTVEEDRIYALIPVHALSRISTLEAVQSIDLDRPMHPDNGPSKEKIR